MLTACNILFMDLCGLDNGRWTLSVIVKRIMSGRISMTWIVTTRISRYNGTLVASDVRINFTIRRASNMDFGTCKTYA